VRDNRLIQVSDWLPHSGNEKIKPQSESELKVPTRKINLNFQHHHLKNFTILRLKSM
jgi:hypothetical protein